MLREIAYGLLGLFSLLFTLDWASSLLDDPREPKRVQTKIPLIGHLIGLLRQRTEYIVAAR